ncbi:hypothetical protein GS934_04055 [Rhodococcus hoagii]|nr:hypothetical protein [Prescottella equi]NKZ87104.1 hypothetical protein [Prescottella equi]
MQFKDGATNIGGPVAVVNGTATAQTSFTTAGSHSITAVFTGSTGFKSSTSSAQTVTVNAPVVQTSLSLSRPSRTPGPRDHLHRCGDARQRGPAPCSSRSTATKLGEASPSRTVLPRCVHVLRCGCAQRRRLVRARGFTNSSATSRPSRCPSRPRGHRHDDGRHRAVDGPPWDSR